jgi:hypothetical protein
MNKLTLLFSSLLFLSVPAGADISYSMDLGNIRGISLGYSMRPLFIFGTNTGTTMFPVNYCYLNIDGFGTVETSNSRAEGVFGGLGIFLGFACKNQSGLLEAKEDYYENQYRLLSLDSHRNDLVLIGGDMRFIFLLPSSSPHSFTSSYFQLSLEFGSLGLNYLGESGAFNKYVEAEKSVNGFYFDLTPGLKFWIFELYASCGFVSGFYEREPQFKKQDKDDRDIANAKSSTWHFLASVGGGITFDFYKMGD